MNRYPLCLSAVFALLSALPAAAAAQDPDSSWIKEVQVSYAPGQEGVTLAITLIDDPNIVAASMDIWASYDGSKIDEVSLPKATPVVWHGPDAASAVFPQVGGALFKVDLEKIDTWNTSVRLAIRLYDENGVGSALSEPNIAFSCLFAAPPAITACNAVPTSPGSIMVTWADPVDPQPGLGALDSFRIVITTTGPVTDATFSGPVPAGEEFYIDIEADEAAPTTFEIGGLQADTAYAAAIKVRKSFVAPGLHPSLFFWSPASPSASATTLPAPTPVAILPGVETPGASSCHAGGAPAGLALLALLLVLARRR